MPRISTDIDRAVGVRIRLRRKELGLNQTALGEKLGVSFQQIQKYENGTNRVSAGCLYQLSKTLSAPIGYFFEDCEATA